MRLTEPDLSIYYRTQYQTEFKKLMQQAKLVNPLFITIRMLQNPEKNLSRLTREKAYENNTQFLNRLHRSLLGNNWKRQHQNGLQRFVVVENAASIGIHTHMLIESLDIDISRFKQQAYEAYSKTSYFGQPFKHFTDGELLNIKPAYSEGVFDYMAKSYSKQDIDLAFDVKNSYWMN